MAIIDGALGLVPMQTPLESQTENFIVTSGSTVYPGQLVKLTSGEVLASTAGAAGPDVGVCMDYAVGIADNSVVATVVVDPNMVYRVKSDAAYDATEIGQFAPLASNGGSSSTLLATGQVDGSAFIDNQTTSTVLTLVGKFDVVAPAGTTNTWVKVKLNYLQLNQIN